MPLFGQVVLQVLLCQKAPIGVQPARLVELLEAHSLCLHFVAGTKSTNIPPHAQHYATGQSLKLRSQ